MTQSVQVARPQAPSLWRAVVLTLLVAGLAAAAGLATGTVAARRAEAALTASAEAEAGFRAAMLSRRLQQFRDVPKVLAEDNDVRNAIGLAPGDPAARALSARLERLTGVTEAEAIYLLGPDGVARAASNWRAARSFLGQDYAFRPYFTEARDQGSYEFYALGTVSAQPGLYLSQRVDAPGGRGVIVVKVHLDDVEADWSRSPGRVAVTDRRGVVILSSEPEWRFGSTRPLSGADLEEIRRARQFGDAFPAAPVRLPAPGDADGPEFAVTHVVERSGWTLTYLVPTDPISTARATGLAIGALSAGLAAIGLIALHNRRRRAEAERRREEAARLELEARVADRTRDLADANQRLTAEIAERRRVETNAQLLQDELVQANRLAVLGQIAAGVAHEINQPLAAIRTFADNAAAFLERRETGEARTNLATIAELSERIATITDELRTMSRKSSGPCEAVDAAAAIDGALVLVGARARAGGVRIERISSGRPMRVMVHRLRLEQVLLNLLQNALDACVGVLDPCIRIETRTGNGEVHVIVADNGPGLAPAAAEALFTPFNTTKSHGLGLGLVISQDICREYGGRLETIASPMSGAAFRIALPEAT